ncbi:MAG: hypothetical protein KAS32_18215 [Candidatus Peribacteraceae bacterium]|nr:hypothetical protein [Candidatus Peribacteraceae bacterium]
MAMFTGIAAAVATAVGAATASAAVGAFAGAVVAGALQGALIGAVIGGVTSAIKGDNIFDGALKGGLMGAMTGAVAGGILGAGGQEGLLAGAGETAGPLTQAQTAAQAPPGIAGLQGGAPLVDGQIAAGTTATAGTGLAQSTKDMLVKGGIEAVGGVGEGIAEAEGAKAAAETAAASQASMLAQQEAAKNVTPVAVAPTQARVQPGLLTVRPEQVQLRGTV